MSKIKFKLEIWDNSVIFKIIDQDKRFIGRNLSYQCKDVKVKINSQQNSKIYFTGNYMELFLRGTLDCDTFNTVTYEAENYEEALKIKNLIILAITEWSENWEGFKIDAKSKSESIYEI